MGSFSVWHWLVLVIPATLILGVILLLVWLDRPRPNEVANTFKVRTVILILLAFLIPMWLITLPVCLFLAYRSYVAGTPAPEATMSPQPHQLMASEKFAASSMSVAGEIEALHRLVAIGALSDAEFQTRKLRLLGSSSVS